MVKRIGGARRDDDQITHLEQWLDTEAPPAAPPGDGASIARGKALFEGAAGCSDCHVGAQKTNNKTAFVGTGSFFQVPRLTAIRWRAPYLHDGCAPTLADRFG